MDFSVKAPSVLCVAVNPEFHDALVCVALGLMCPLLPCLALTLIPVFGEIITDYCLKKISPVLMAKHSSGLVAPCLEAVNGSSWMALKQAARGKKPKRPRNKGQEEKEEEAERVLMSFNSSQRVWCKRLRL